MGNSQQGTSTYRTLLAMEVVDEERPKGGSDRDEFEAQKRQVDALFLASLLEFDGLKIKDKVLGAYGVFDNSPGAVQCALAFQEKRRERDMGAPCP